MSSDITINGLTLLPLKEAAKNFSYTKDYVARLAREQKIVATQIGRQWYVDPLSLKNFVDIAELEQAVKRSYLSEDRKREQAIKNRVSQIKSVKKSKIGARTKKISHAIAVAVVGVVFAFGISDLSVDFSKSAGHEVLLINEATGFAVASPMPTAILNTVEDKSSTVFFEESVEAISTTTSGVLLVAKGFDREFGLAEVEQMFSDDVEVLYADDGSGVILFKNSEGVLERRDFVSLPDMSFRSSDVRQ